MTLKKVGQMNIEVKVGVLARKLGKDFKDEGFIPLQPGTYKISGPEEHMSFSLPEPHPCAADPFMHPVNLVFIALNELNMGFKPYSALTAEKNVQAFYSAHLMTLFIMFRRNSLQRMVVQTLRS